MNKYFYIIIFSFLVTNCNINKVTKHHGVRFLEIKQEKLIINTSNKNDIISILGPPSTKSTFNNDLWIYIERTQSKKSLIKLGSDIIIINNVLVLEVDNMGLLVKKDFYDISKMNELEFSSKTTKNSYEQESFLYNFLSSMRQKINDPLGKRKKP